PEMHHNYIFSYDFMSPAFRKFTVSIERLFAQGKLGVRLPWSLGVGTGYYNNIKWSTGLEIKAYPLGQRTHNYVFSFQGEVGELGRYNYNNFFAFYAKNGYSFYPIEHMSFSTALGLGFRKDLDSDSQLQESAIFEITVDYRF